MKLNIAKEVASLQRMTVRELRRRYAEVFGEETRANIIHGQRFRSVALIIGRHEQWIDVTVRWIVFGRFGQWSVRIRYAERYIQRHRLVVWWRHVKWARHIVWRRDVKWGR